MLSADGSFGSDAILFVASGGDGTFNPFEFAPGATIWTWAIFLLALPFMWKFVFGPITRALAARDQEVIDAAKAAETARKEAEAAVSAARAEQEQARAEARKLVAEATARAERQGEEALAKAKAEAERQMQKVREDIASEKRRAMQEIRDEVVRLSIASAGSILKKDIDDAEHQRFVQDFVGNLDSRKN